MTKQRVQTWKKLAMSSDEQQDYEREFKKKARFLVDQNLGCAVAEVIRDEGYNAIYAAEANLMDHSDEDYFAFAQRDDRILLTHDVDFWDDHKFPSHGNPGLVILPGASGDDRRLMRALVAVFEIIAPYREIWRKSKVWITADEGIWCLTVKGVDFAGQRYLSRYKYDKHDNFIWREGN